MKVVPMSVFFATMAAHMQRLGPAHVRAFQFSALPLSTRTARSRSSMSPSSSLSPSDVSRSQSARFYSRQSIALNAATAEKVETKKAEVVEELPTNENDNDLLKLRHSSAHVMAMAVQEVFPEAQVTIGPWIDNGFYYDFYFPETTDAETGETVPSRKLTDQDLKQVKKRMDKIISKDYPIEREEVTREEAKRRIEEIGEPFKLEILDSIKTEPITIYKIGEEWWDLCAGPHVDSTGQLPKKAIQLQSVAGAYWRGDEKREMLQRIYATAWKDPQQLKQYKKMMEEAKKRDHRVLGKKLDLFSIQVRAGTHSFGWLLACFPSQWLACDCIFLILWNKGNGCLHVLYHLTCVISIYLCIYLCRAGGRRWWIGFLASQGIRHPSEH